MSRYIKKGYARGEACKRSSLTEGDVRAMREAYISPCPHCGKCPTCGELAERYGISKVMVWKIVTRGAWAHVA